VTITSDPPLDGEICAGHSVKFSCNINSGYVASKYQWTVGYEEPKTGDSTCVVQVSSEVNVTCTVTAVSSQDSSNGNIKASSSVIALPGGKFITVIQLHSLVPTQFTLPCGCVCCLLYMLSNFISALRIFSVNNCSVYLSLAF